MSVKKISNVEEIEPVISVLTSAFLDDPSTGFAISMLVSRDTAA